MPVARELDKQSIVISNSTDFNTNHEGAAGIVSVGILSGTLTPWKLCVVSSLLNEGRITFFKSNLLCILHVEGRMDTMKTWLIFFSLFLLDIELTCKDSPIVLLIL